MSIATITDTRAGAEQSIADLLLAAREGSESAWEEISRRYSRLIFSTVQSFRLSEADARDAVQTTWLRLLENYQRIQSPERLGGWLVTTARRECLRILRQAKRVSNVELMEDALIDDSAGPEQRAVEANTARTLHNLFAELPPRQRTVLSALFADSPLPYTEIGRIAGIPTGSIGPTRARALAQLRRQLREHELV